MNYWIQRAPYDTTDGEFETVDELLKFFDAHDWSQHQNVPPASVIAIATDSRYQSRFNAACLWHHSYENRKFLLPRHRPRLSRLSGLFTRARQARTPHASATWILTAGLRQSNFRISALHFDESGHSDLHRWSNRKIVEVTRFLVSIWGEKWSAYIEQGYRQAPLTNSFF